MFKKIETLVMELRKLEHIHICQELSIDTVYERDALSRTEGELKQIIQKVHIIMFEYVDRRKFDEYKMVLDAEYSSDEKDEVLEVLYNRMIELKEIYTNKEEE